MRFKFFYEHRFVFLNVVKENMEGIGVPEFRVNTVGGITGAFAISPLVHHRE